jgi:hypothetical protein
MLWEMSQVMRAPHRPQANWRQALEDKLSCFAHVASLHERADAPGREAIRRNLYGVLRWIAWANQVAFDKPQRRAGWDYLVRSAAQWDKERREWLELEGKRWPVPMAPREIYPFLVQFLENGVQLWQEGNAMHHCADSLADACEKGHVLCFSVRDREDGHRIATVALRRRDVGRGQRSPRWELWQMARVGNRPVRDPRVRPFVSWILATMERLGWTPFPPEEGFEGRPRK